MGRREAPNKPKVTQLNYVSTLGNYWQKIKNLQPNKRIALRLSVHAIGNSLANRLEAAKRSSVANVL